MYTINALQAVILQANKMELRIIFLVITCFQACWGLEFTLNRETSDSERSRRTCGILVCEENTKALVSFPSEVSLNTISSMTVFKKGYSPSDQKAFLLGSLTTQTPTLTRVANGRKQNGSLQSTRAILNIELSKQADCESEFSCRVVGKDEQGREVVSTASLLRQPTNQRAGAPHLGSLTSAVPLQVLASIQQLAQTINGLENRLEDKVASLENRIEDKMFILQNSLAQLQKDVTKVEDKLENRIEDKMFILQNSLAQLQKDVTKVEDKLENIENTVKQLPQDIASKADSFERRLQDKLDRLENRIENEIHEKIQGNDLQPNTKASSWRDTICKDAKERIDVKLDSIQQRLIDVQEETLKNVSDRFEKTVRNASALLSSLMGDVDVRKQCDQTAEIKTDNETKSLLEKLTSGEIAVRCLDNETTSTETVFLPPLMCERDMGKGLNQSYPHYFKMTDYGLGRKILGDTQTDGGGWTVILRRTKGDVYFNRDWESYKEGFGVLELDEDFWFGNENVHKLTYFRPYELRVELTSKGKEYVEVYSTFKLESEADKYTLRLGAGTKSIDDGSHGLSYSNNAAFTTFDQDNDSWENNCAVSRKCGWWYKDCNWSKLTTPWINGWAKHAWYNGKKWLGATRVEMKIRPLQSD